MATIRFEGSQADLPDGSKVVETCEVLGIPFGCQDGVCGTCTSVVVGGMENLEPKNDKEKDMDLESDERLPCQCTIKHGVVEFSLG